MGPESAQRSPSYREVCSGRTGHAEVLEVDIHDAEGVGKAALFEDFLHFFFQFHDPTTYDKQGADVGRCGSWSQRHQYEVNAGLCEIRFAVQVHNLRA